MDVRRAAAIALTVLAVAFRIAAVAFAVLTVLLCFPSAAARLGITGFVIDLSHALPELIQGFALACAGLFVLDYTCQRIAYKLR